MNTQRTVRFIGESVPAMDGAGVRLRRAFGNLRGMNLDPFLLLDSFGSENPEDYMAGFPWHPHRGMETVTYMVKGKVEHQDSLGNKGLLKPGEIQWMTAGSGIIHQEMPEMPDKAGDGTLTGFQLWVNLPKSHKMMKPRYQDIKTHEIKDITIDNSVNVKVLAGEFNGVHGAVKDVIAEPTYLDIKLEQENSFEYKVPENHTVMAYVINGNGFFDHTNKMNVGKDNLVVFNHGEEINISTDKDSLRFLLMSGKPLHEEVAWQGPIVMNTQDELRMAFMELQNNTFIKHEYKV